MQKENKTLFWSMLRLHDHFPATDASEKPAALIISDNHYFATGLQFYLSSAFNVRVCVPENIALQTEAVKMYFVFISDRHSHLMVCRTLRELSPDVVFFLPGNGSNVMEQFTEYIWPARLSLRELNVRILNISCPSRRKRRNKPPKGLSKIRIRKSATGLESYLDWVKDRRSSRKTVYFHNRQLIRSVGLERASVHNLFLAEYLAAAHLVVMHKDTN